MERSFDPYYEWLKIPPEVQPPDHYQLLGLPRFEDDESRLREAAKDRTALIRRFQLGPQSEASQRLLTEIAAAQSCLLNSQSKRAYDAKLGRPDSDPHANSLADAAIGVQSELSELKRETVVAGARLPQRPPPLRPPIKALPADVAARPLSERLSSWLRIVFPFNDATGPTAPARHRPRVFVVGAIAVGGLVTLAVAAVAVAGLISLMTSPGDERLARNPSEVPDDEPISAEVSESPATTNQAPAFASIDEATITLRGRALAALSAGLQAEVRRIGEAVETTVAKRVDWLRSADTPADAETWRLHGWLRTPTIANYQFILASDGQLNWQMDGRQIRSFDNPDNQDSNAPGSENSRTLEDMLRVRFARSIYRAEFSLGPVGPVEIDISFPRTLNFVQLRWLRPDGIEEIVPESAFFQDRQSAEAAPPAVELSQPTGRGLECRRYGQRDFTELIGVRTDRQLDWVWDSESPIGVSAVWKGRIVPKQPGRYRLALDHSGSAELRIDGRRMLDSDNSDRFQRQIADGVQLWPSGHEVEIRYRHYWNADSAGMLSFRWQEPGADDFTVVPSEVLQPLPEADVAQPEPATTPARRIVDDDQIRRWVSEIETLADSGRLVDAWQRIDEVASVLWKYGITAPQAAAAGFKGLDNYFLLEPKMDAVDRVTKAVARGRVQAGVEPNIHLTLAYLKLTEWALVSEDFSLAIACNDRAQQAIENVKTVNRKQQGQRSQAQADIKKRAQDLIEAQAESARLPEIGTALSHDSTDKHNLYRLGYYNAIVQGHWRLASHLFVAGDDPEFEKIGRGEILLANLLRSTNDRSAALRVLGDLQWAAANRIRGQTLAPSRLRLRAARWYKLASSRLSGVQAREAARRASEASYHWAQVQIPVERRIDTTAFPQFNAAGPPDGNGMEAGFSEFLELDFGHAVEPLLVFVYESSPDFSIQSIAAIQNDGKEKSLWDSGEKIGAQGVSILSVSSGQRTTTRRLRIYPSRFLRIDAVGLFDVQGRTHWAVHPVPQRVDENVLAAPGGDGIVPRGQAPGPGDAGRPLEPYAGWVWIQGRDQLAFNRLLAAVVQATRGQRQLTAAEFELIRRRTNITLPAPPPGYEYYYQPVAASGASSPFSRFGNLTLRPVQSP